MELWVRSQDKKLLCKIDSLFIEEELYKRKGKYRIMANNGWLGAYNSFERALEILDEIHEYIEKQGQDYLLTNENGIITGRKHYGNVYQMPEK